MRAIVVINGKRRAFTAAPICQIDFCDNCGDCLDCHAEDGCRGADGEWDPAAQHSWYIDEDYVERWLDLHPDHTEHPL